MPPYWWYELDEVVDVATVDKLHAGYEFLYDTWKENKRISSLRSYAPNANTAVFRVSQRQISFSRFEVHTRIDVRFKNSGPDSAAGQGEHGRNKLSVRIS